MILHEPRRRLQATFLGAVGPVTLSSQSTATSLPQQHHYRRDAVVGPITSQPFSAILTNQCQVILPRRSERPCHERELLANSCVPASGDASSHPRNIFRPCLAKQLREESHHVLTMSVYASLGQGKGQAEPGGWRAEGSAENKRSRRPETRRRRNRTRRTKMGRRTSQMMPRRRCRRRPTVALTVDMEPLAAWAATPRRGRHTSSRKWSSQSELAVATS